jgi:flagellar hook-associated protein 3 FlgL
MRNLNTNYDKVDKLQNMMASGRKFAHISDDPIALIYSQSSRNKLARLSHYQTSVGSAKDWLDQAENGLMELQNVFANAYESCVDATHDGKTDSDKRNIGKVIGQLREHFVDTLNAAFGDKYVYAAYNTPGDPASSMLSYGIKPFSVKNDELYYNGFNLSQFDGMPVELLNFKPTNVYDIPGTKAELQKYVTDNGINASGYDLDEVAKLLRLKSDELTFDVGPGIGMPVTMHGIDLVFFRSIDGGDTVVRSAYEVLCDLYEGTTGEKTGQVKSAEELTLMIKPLQEAQNHLLTQTAVIGGRTRRLELLEARYEQDAINYQRMKSDAEDVDMAEVIMNLRISESVLQSSMSAGARIIQPSLMDFLR